MTEEITTLEPIIFCNITEEEIWKTTFPAIQPLIDYVCADYGLNIHLADDVMTAMNIIINAAKCN